MALLPLPVGSTASVSRPAPTASSARRWDGRSAKPKTDSAIRSTAAASVIVSILPYLLRPIAPTEPHYPEWRHGSGNRLRRAGTARSGDGAAGRAPRPAGPVLVQSRPEPDRRGPVPGVDAVDHQPADLLRG